MSDLKKILGDRIRTVRKKAGLSQEELAKKAAISGKYLGEIERGTANLTIDVMEKISMALDIEVLNLLDNEHEQDRNIVESKVNLLIQKTSDQDLKTIFRIIKTILR